MESWLGKSSGGCCGESRRDKQKTCTAVLEVTARCNLACPVCFADANPGGSHAGDPPLGVLEASLRDLYQHQGPVNLQLSGGEPTLRPDLERLISTAREIGFTFVQVNTNGLALANSPEYASALRASGLESVFLQFDGLHDETYLATRGRPLLEQKLLAIDNCAAAGLGVVLVPTLVPGVNDGELGALVRFAAQRNPVVRGLHIQPISYFGRHPGGERPRLTIPEVLRELETQTGGEVEVEDFSPSDCEHARCSFRARYRVADDTHLELVEAKRSCCSGKTEDAPRRAIDATSRQWSSAAQVGGEDSLSAFLEDATKILCISGMAFQDARNLELDRIDSCCVHSLVPGRGLVPFCLWNLTNSSGEHLLSR